jgi:hypothetical protein
MLLAGCGGGEDTSEAPAPPPALTTAAVKACLLKAGAAPEALAPQQPKAAPRHFQRVYFEGPVTGHIAIMLSREPIFSQGLARAYTAQQEYLATAVRGGRAMILLDNYKPNPNRALAFKCVVG